MSTSITGTIHAKAAGQVVAASTPTQEVLELCCKALGREFGATERQLAKRLDSNWFSTAQEIAAMSPVSNRSWSSDQPPPNIFLIGIKDTFLGAPDPAASHLPPVSACTSVSMGTPVSEQGF